MLRPTAGAGAATAPLRMEQFQIVSQIGTGSFGTVYRAVHRPTQRQCAIKRIDLENSDDDIEEIQKEIAILATCKDEHITRYFGCFMHEFELYIVMEFLGGGSCLDLMKDLRPTPLSEPAIAEILAQVVEGLAYLHDGGKIHRDIKAANVLISESGDVKIADFGVAAQLSNTLSRRNTFVGTPFWMAPEVIDQLDYSFSADVWSLGITAIELALGKPPLSSLHPMKALFSIPRNPPPRLDGRYSPQFRDFVAQCLQSKPAARAPIRALRQHRFLRERSRPALLELMQQRLPPAAAASAASAAAGEAGTASTSDSTSRLSSGLSSGFSDSTAVGTLSTLNSGNNIDSKSSVDDDAGGSDDDDDGWDFDTVKPQPSIEQILQHPPPSLRPPPAPVRRRDLTSAGTLVGTETHSFGRIFAHAAHKFREPVLMEISELLQTDPLTVGVEQYLVKRIARLAPRERGFDAVERILLDKWMSERT